MKMYHNEEEMTLDDNEYKYDDIIYEQEFDFLELW